MRPILRLQLIGLVVLTLAGCAAREAPRPCPSVVVLPGADRLTRFDGNGRDLTDVVFEAEFQNVRLTCEYDENAVEAVLQFRLLVAEGPADTSGRADIRYFVAVGTRDRRILAREEFALDIPFTGNKRRVAAVEEIAQRIPLEAGRSGADYVVYLGLAVRPDELRYNLDNRSPLAR